MFKPIFDNTQIAKYVSDGAQTGRCVCIQLCTAHSAEESDHLICDLASIHA